MRIGITPQSFSKNPTLREELEALFPDSVFNDAVGHPRLGDLARLLRDCDGAVVGLEPVTEALLRRCPRLRIVSKYGVGLDNVDIPACRRRGVAVGWTPGTNRLAVAEMTLGLILASLRNVVHSCERLREGHWDKTVGVELSGKTVGVIGVGNVGKEVVRLLAPFRCRILANDIAPMGSFFRKNGLVAATKGRIWREADVVTLHVPLTARTRGLVDRDTLSRMKKTAILVNTARGPVVDPKALRRALVDGVIAGAALDVYCEEPPRDKELLTLPNLICTPHRAGSSREAVLAMGRSAIGHLQRFFLEGGA